MVDVNYTVSVDRASNEAVQTADINVRQISYMIIVVGTKMSLSRLT